MVVINHFIYKDHVELELKGSFIKDAGLSYAQLLAAGFKFNKVRRTYFKSYFNKEYTEEKFQPDIELVKKIWKDYKYQVFKLVKQEASYAA